MKKIVSLSLVAMLLLVMSTALAGSAGTSADPLISQSYITNTLVPETRTEAQSVISSELGSAYDSAYSKLESIYSAYALRFGTPEGYTLSNGRIMLDLGASSSVHLITGGSFVLNSGSAAVTVEAGTVINLTDGSEVASGTMLSENVRYFCAENTVAAFTAVSGASAMIDGYYKLSGSISAPLPFSDVNASQWFYDAVSFVNERGYMTGISSNEFGVSKETTRAVFVTALYRMAGEPAVAGVSSLTDVTDPSLYYYNAVIWSHANGVITGHDDDTFRPHDSITREQMAAVMYRFVRYLGYDVSNLDSTVYDSFPDNATVNAYAVEPVKWATANKLINGMDGKINPGGTAIRAQVAQIILNFYEFLA